MISTIGSLVQETSIRLRWFIATTLYIGACLSTSLLLGMLLSSFGLFLQHISCSASVCGPLSFIETALIGIMAVAYAFSDVGIFCLPRPKLMYAIPVTWWRSWRPYGAAVAYGAALGLGVMTRVQFGAFYVLCLLCILKGDIAYGAALMGTYGAARALMLIPASCGVYLQRTGSEARLQRILNSIGNAKLIVAVALILFGAHVLASLLF